MFVKIFGNEVNGDFLVITDKVFIIIINDIIIHKIVYKNKKLEENHNYNLEKIKGRKYYFMEILNPDEVDTITILQFGC